MSTRKVPLFNLQFDAIGLGDAAQLVTDISRATARNLVMPVNVDVLMQVQEDAELREICKSAAVLLADGMPIVWMSRFLGVPLPERVTGADLLPEICRFAATSGARVFFMGGQPGAAAETARRLSIRHPELIVAGTVCPPFGFEEDPVESARIVSQINESHVHILFIGVGAPKQEKWIARHRGQLSIGSAICVGAAFDFAAGYVTRAPKFLRSAGLEWAWRLGKEPRRLWRRYILRDAAFFRLAIRSLLTSRPHDDRY